MKQRFTTCATIVSHATSVLVRYELHRKFRPSQNARLIRQYRDDLCDGMLDRLGAVVSITDDRGPLTRNRGTLVVANHQSAIDILLMLKLFDGVMLSRADVAGWPLFGRLAEHGGTIFVDRGNGASGARAIRAIRSALKSGDTVMVFPEGGTFCEQDVVTFQTGVFVAARGLDVNIVPVGIAYDPRIAFVDKSFGAHTLELASQGAMDVAVSIGAPVADTARPSRVLATDLQKHVQALYVRSRDRLANPAH